MFNNTHFILSGLTVGLGVVEMKKKKKMENPGIDPGTSRMLSERSTIWANSPSAPFCQFWQGIDRLPDFSLRLRFFSACVGLMTNISDGKSRSLISFPFFFFFFFSFFLFSSLPLHLWCQSSILLPFIKPRHSYSVAFFQVPSRAVSTRWPAINPPLLPPLMITADIKQVYWLKYKEYSTLYRDYCESTSDTGICGRKHAG